MAEAAAAAGSTGRRWCGSGRSRRTALAESRPGIKASGRDFELDAAKAEIARLSETVKEVAVKLMLVKGNGGWG
ncbi:MAG TPA: hypothetical protein VIJ23_19900 [Mycobacterium sp.]